MQLVPVVYFDQPLGAACLNANPQQLFTPKHYQPAIGVGSQTLKTSFFSFSFEIEIKFIEFQESTAFGRVIQHNNITTKKTKSSIHLDKSHLY